MKTELESFQNIIHTYLTGYADFPKGKVEFECDYGELVFYKDQPTVLVLHSIYIVPEHREKGLCRAILQYLIDICVPSFHFFRVESVLSTVLYMYLSRFTYHGKKFQNTTQGFLYTI